MASAEAVEVAVDTRSHSQSCIVVLIGIPGSGKTTFTKLFGEASGEGEAEMCSTKTISFDQVLPLEEQKNLATSGEEVNSSGEWKRARQEMRDLVKTELTASSSKVVLVDDNNYYRSMRHEYYQLARDMGVGFCQIFMQVDDVNTALYANRSRDEKERVPEGVIRSMAHKLEPPDPMTNPWETFSFIVNAQHFRNSSKEILHTCRCVVKAAASNPPVIPPIPEHRSESARQESRLVCDKSLIHKLDKRLRKIVGARIALALEGVPSGENGDSINDSQAKEVGLAMVKARTEILAELKAERDPNFRLPDQLTQKVKDSDVSCEDDLLKVLNKMFDLKLNQLSQK